MARLPTVEDLGSRPTPQSNRQVVSVRNAGAVGEAVSSVGVKMGEVVDHLQDTWDESDVRRLDGEHDEAVRKIREQALAVRGEGAAAARVAADEQIQALNEEVLGRARSNRSRIVLERILTPRARAERSTIGRHATDETAAVLDGQFVARRDQYIRRAQESWDNPDAAEEALTVARGEVANRGQWRGWSPEQVQAEQATVTSSIRQGIAERMITNGRYDEALAYVEAHRGEIDHGAENELRAAIRGPMLEDRGEAIVNNLPAITGAAPTPGQPAQSTAPNPAFVDSFSRYNQDSRGQRPGAPRRYRGGTHAANGRDYGMPMNTPLRAELDWEMAPSPRPRDNGRTHGDDRHGKWFSVRYSDGSTHIFRHVNTLPTRASGRAGEEMARSGNSGIGSSGPHTHRESWDASGQLIDPQAYIDRNRGTAPQRAAGSSVPTGRQIDYGEARRQIEAMGLPRDERRAALTALDRRITAEDRVIARDTDAAVDELSRRLIDIQSNGGRLTSITQIDAGLLTRLRRYAPERVTQIQQTIEANNRPVAPEANSPLMASLFIMSAQEPERFLSLQPELFRGRVTDGEVMELHRLNATIRDRQAPQPSQIMAMINMVLPQTDLIPRDVSSQRQGSGRGRETEAAARNRIADGFRARLFSAVRSRIMQNYRQGVRVTEQEILDAVRAETMMIMIPLRRQPEPDRPPRMSLGQHVGSALIGGTVWGRASRIQQQRDGTPPGNRQPEALRMRMFEAREVLGDQPQNFQIVIPTRALPYIDRVLRQAGRPVSGQERIAEYLRHKTAYDSR